MSRTRLVPLLQEPKDCLLNNEKDYDMSPNHNATDQMVCKVSPEPEQPKMTTDKDNKNKISLLDLLEAGPSSQYRDHNGQWRCYYTHTVIEGREKPTRNFFRPRSDNISKYQKSKIPQPKCINVQDRKLILNNKDGDSSHEYQKSQIPLPKWINKTDEKRILNKGGKPVAACKYALIRSRSGTILVISPGCGNPTLAFPCDSTTLGFGPVNGESDDAVVPDSIIPY